MMWTIIVGLAIQTFFSQNEKVEAEIFKSSDLSRALWSRNDFFFYFSFFFLNVQIFGFTSFCVLQRPRLKGREFIFLLMIILRNFGFDSLFFRAFRVNNFFSRARIKVPFCQKLRAPFFASFIELIVELVIGLKRDFCVGTAYFKQKSILLSQMINRCTDHVRFRTWLEVGMFWENF